MKYRQLFFRNKKRAGQRDLFSNSCEQLCLTEDEGILHEDSYGFVLDRTIQLENRSLPLRLTEDVTTL